MAWSRESRHKRGYGAAWDKLRKQILERDFGLCQVCRKVHRRVTVATQVDHIVSKAKAAKLRWPQSRIDHPDNLQSICTPCHDRKTQEEQGKSFEPRPTIGPDGWPMG